MTNITSLTKISGILNFSFSGSITAFLALYGNLITDANGDRFLVNSKGDDVLSTTGKQTYLSDTQSLNFTFSASNYVRYYKDNVLAEITTASQTTLNITDGQYSLVMAFDAEISQADKDYIDENPELSVRHLSLSDTYVDTNLTVTKGECNLNAPLFLVGNTQRDYSTNTDYIISNYTTVCDLIGLSYGIQSIAFLSNGLAANTMSYDASQPVQVIAALSDYVARPIASGIPIFTDGTIGVAYSYDTSILFTGGAVDTYSVNGTLPNGLSINPSTGEISGTPTTAEVDTISITAENSGGIATTIASSITIVAAATEYLDTVNSAVSNGDETTTFTRNSPTNFDLAVTVAGTDGTNPRLFLLTTPSTLLAGNYTIKADVTVNSGTCVFVRTYAGTTVTDGRTLATGSYEFAVTANGAVANVLMYFNGTNTFDINFTNISIVEAP